MSVANLETPNNLNLFCNELTCNVLNAASQSSTSLTLTSTGAPALTINETGVLTGPLVSINSTGDTSNNNLMQFTSDQTASRIDITNNNPAAFAVELQIKGNGQSTSGEFGINNATNTTYLASYHGRDLRFMVSTDGNTNERYRILAANGGITSNYNPNIVLNGYEVHYFSGQTLGAGAAILFNYQTVTGRVYTFYEVAQALTTTNLSLSRTTVGLVKNIAGTATIVANQGVIIAGFNEAGLNGATLSTVLNGSPQVGVEVGGVAGFTINWTGYVIISY